LFNNITKIWDLKCIFQGNQIKSVNKKADMKMDEEYYAAQKIIFDIISWKPNVNDINHQQFQQFETYDQKFIINRKLLNEKM
ncbi:hypothetical protein RFI_34271, partial [Reticulomyxa filosa]